MRYIGGVNIPEYLYDPIPIGIEQMLALLEKQNDTATTKTRKMPIFLALMEGKIEKLKTMLRNGTDPNQADEYGKTLLHYATEYSMDKKFFRLLLECGANVNASTKNGLSPLIIAVLYNSTDIANLLINHRANVKDSNNILQWTPLHLASLLGNNDIVTVLIRKGADVNAAPANQEDHTPLFFATNSNATETAKLLLDSGAATNGSAFDASAVYAKKKRLQALVKLLLDRADDQEMLTILLKNVDGGR